MPEPLSEVARFFFCLEHDPRQIILFGRSRFFSAVAVGGCMNRHQHILRLIDEQVYYFPSIVSL